MVQHTDEVDVGVGELIALYLGVGHSWGGELPSFQADTIRVSSPALWRLAHSIQQGAAPVLLLQSLSLCHQGMLYCLPGQGAGPSLLVAAVGIGGRSALLPHPLRAGSLTPLTTGSNLVCCPGWVQGPPSCVLQLVRGRDSSLTHMGPATGAKTKGCRQASWGGGVSSPAFRPLGLAHLYPRLQDHRVSSSVLLG